MIINTPKSLAAFVKDSRKQKGLSQSEVASRVGLRQATISEFENNPDRTSIETIFKILASMKLELHLVSENSSMKTSSISVSNGDEW
ncbi:helix-turn-helix domain-containing protein [Vibrio sp. S17_S38]|uniref:helix-turn-helix domain-containing protein n=1 Tax=Vibrio sp. S17_S38 TaxID=2720229 RepID=UPI001680A760|nr:helix-turn-helix domain-containing protein [Vibrio sp. S17_S38]MBD1574592.1 helix-turn-helix domain-containing protein [Vibrio sp. S17_S38]